MRYFLHMFNYNKNYQYFVLDMLKILEILCKTTKFINWEIEINNFN